MAILTSVNTTKLAELLQGGSTPLLRTDFTDAAAWELIVAAVTAPVDFGSEASEDDDGLGEEGDYAPNITPIADPAFEGVTGEALGAAWTRDEVGYMLLADQASMTDGTDLTIVYVDLYDEPGRTFRCVVGEVASIEANLSIANMDFEVADSIGRDGVFRGFDD